MLYPLIRKFFFALDPELAHGLGMSGIGFLNRAGIACLLAKPIAADPVELMGLVFPNPVGLAAGLDKNGEHIDALASLGFGFIEIGTVTPRPQPGNPKPRMFRITEKQAIINRMGFNNHGVDQLLANVAKSKFAQAGGILGINIGKNFDTPIEKAVDDYLICLDRVYTAASYVAINISSPNTKNLRELQKDDALDALLGQLKAEQTRLAEKHGKYVPLVLKIAPDLEDEQIRPIADLLMPHPGVALRSAELAASLALISLASALYYTADLGVSPYDAVALILADRTGVPFRFCRIATDSVCVLVGFSFGATLGVGTILTALCMGPLVDLFNRCVAQPLQRRYSRPQRLQAQSC